MQSDEYYMHLALQEAEHAFSRGEIPVGAVIISAKGTILSATHNEKEFLLDATAHAEIIAIRRASLKLSSWKLNGTTMYVTMEPCPMCAGAIVLSRISRLVYGAPDSKGGGVESIFNILEHPSLNHHPKITAGILELECENLLKRFFARLRANKS